MIAKRFHSRANSRDRSGSRLEIRSRPFPPSRDGRTTQDQAAASTALQTVSATRTLIALLFAPLAWLAQLGIAELVLGQGCLKNATAGGPVFVVLAMPWTPTSLAVASLACLVFGGLGGWVAWRNLLRTAQISWRFPTALRGTRAERDWFVSRVCALSSTMFVLGLMTTDIAMLLITPCSIW